jgi:hypothetical protein
MYYFLFLRTGGPDTDFWTFIQAKLEIRNIEVVYLFQFGTGSNALKIVSITGFTDSERYLELRPRKNQLCASQRSH